MEFSVITSFDEATAQERKIKECANILRHEILEAFQSQTQKTWPPTAQDLK